MEKLMELINNQPENINARMELVRQYLESQNLEKAKPLLEEILALDSCHVDANFIMGQILEFEEDYSGAIKCFETVAEKHPSSDLQYKLANAYENNDEYDKAHNLYIQLYNVLPADTNLCERVAHTARILNDNNEALDFYSRLLALEPDNIVALTQLAEIYEEEGQSFFQNLTRARISEIEGNLSHAISNYKKALAEAEKQEDAIQIRLAIAGMQIKKENYLQAIDEFLSVLELDENNFEIYLNLAELYLKLENEHSAADAFEKALTIYPDNADVLSELAEIYMELEEFEKAEEKLNRLVKIQPEDLSCKAELARTLIALKKDNEATEILNTIILKDPKNAEAHGIFADYYLIKKEPEKALEFALKIKEIIPQSPFGYKKAGEIYEVLGQRFESHFNFAIYHDLKGEKQLAIDEFSWALQKNPGNVDIILRLAKLYEDISEHYIAIEHYQKAYELDEDNLSALQKLSDIYMKKKDYEQAIEGYSKLINSGTSNRENYYNLAFAYECIKNYDLALENYNKFLSIAGLSAKADETKSRIARIEEKINGEESEGILNKLLGFFSRK